MANGYDQNWDLNSYNRIYGNNNLDARFQGESDIYQNMDQDMNYRGADPFGSFNSGIGSFYHQRPPQGITFNPAQGNRGFMEEPSGVGEGYDKRRFRDVIGNKLSRFTTPVMSVLKGIKDQFKYRGATEEAWDPNTGQFISAEEQDKMNALGGYYSDAARNQRKQRARVVNMLARQAEGKSFSQKNLERLQKLGYGKGPEEIIPTTTVGDNINQGGGGGSEAAFTQTSPGGISQQTSRDARGGMSGWRLAQGGRAGYQGGELVEDEYMEEATPGGMIEENIEEVQGEPSREQLEAIAFEIFQLPLEQLNEEQLEVVYQAAMEQEPSEEEVQFAAQEGPGEGIASLV